MQTDVRKCLCPTTLLTPSPWIISNRWAAPALPTAGTAERRPRWTDHCAVHAGAHGNKQQNKQTEFATKTLPACVILVSIFTLLVQSVILIAGRNCSCWSCCQVQVSVWYSSSVVKCRKYERLCLWAWSIWRHGNLYRVQLLSIASQDLVSLENMSNMLALTLDLFLYPFFFISFPQQNLWNPGCARGWETAIRQAVADRRNVYNICSPLGPPVGR